MYPGLPYTAWKHVNSRRHRLRRLILLLIVFYEAFSTNNIEIVKSCQDCFFF